MKKNAFTLIELLAVIAILAIVLLIAIPTVLNMIEKSRKGAFIDNSLSAIKAAKTQVGLSLMNDANVNVVWDDNKAILEIGEELKINELNGIVEIIRDGNKYKYRIYASSGNYSLCGKYEEEIKVENIQNKVICENVETIMVADMASDDTYQFLGGNIQRKKIKTITFTDTNVVPGGVLGSWDVSAHKTGLVMAWYTDAGDGFYNLFIGQNGGVKANPNSAYLIRYFTNLTSIDFTHFDTSRAVNMDRMFYWASGLVNLDLSNFNTSKVTNMTYMLSNLRSLISLNVSGFNTSNVTSMYSMFYYNISLTSLDLSNFDTSKVEDMSNMFRVCTSLESLTVGNFNTSKAITMRGMFMDVSNLENLDISTFTTAQEVDMGSMFRNMTVLENLDIRNMSFDSVMDTSLMFGGTTEDPTVIVKDAKARDFILNIKPSLNVVIL